MDSKAFLDRDDAKYGAYILRGFGPQYFCASDLCQLPNCLKIVIRKPLGNIRVVASLAGEFDDRDDRVSVPAKPASLLIASNKKWNSGE